MANLLSYDAGQLLAFILVLVRVSGIISTAPIFGSSVSPPQVKIVLSLMLGLMAKPVPTMRDGHTHVSRLRSAGPGVLDARTLSAWSDPHRYTFLLKPRPAVAWS